MSSVAGKSTNALHTSHHQHTSSQRITYHFEDKLVCDNSCANNFSLLYSTIVCWKKKSVLYGVKQQKGSPVIISIQHVSPYTRFNTKLYKFVYGVKLTKKEKKDALFCWQTDVIKTNTYIYFKGSQGERFFWNVTCILSNTPVMFLVHVNLNDINLLGSLKRFICEIICRTP